MVPDSISLADWVGTAPPSTENMQGRFCRLEALDIARHGQGLITAFAHDRDKANWTWLPYGPFPTGQAMLDFYAGFEGQHDPLFFTIIDAASNQPVGLAAYLRITPEHGVAEIGHLNFSPLMQRSPLSTEAMYLMMQRVFDSGYRRCEWKCNSLNGPSNAAALRLGFTYEGCFRQDRVVKDQSRDTNWYSVIDREWPDRQEAMQRWLAPANFDSDGKQHTSLADCRKSVTQ